MPRIILPYFLCCWAVVENVEESLSGRWQCFCIPAMTWAGRSLDSQGQTPSLKSWSRRGYSSIAANICCRVGWIDDLVHTDIFKNLKVFLLPTMVRPRHTLFPEKGIETRCSMTRDDSMHQ